MKQIEISLTVYSIQELSVNAQIVAYSKWKMSSLYFNSISDFIHACNFNGLSFLENGTMYDGLIDEHRKVDNLARFSLIGFNPDIPKVG